MRRQETATETSVVVPFVKERYQRTSTVNTTVNAVMLMVSVSSYD